MGVAGSHRLLGNRLGLLRPTGRGLRSERELKNTPAAEVAAAPIGSSVCGRDPAMDGSACRCCNDVSRYTWLPSW
jgi:hypothetical protein